MNITRREFFGVIGSALVGASALLLPKVEKEKPTISEIDHVYPGDLQLASKQNEIIDAINQLSQGE